MTEISFFAASKTAQYANRPSSGGGRPVGSDEENDENKEDDRLFCGFAFGEDDLVHEEEDDHRDAAVEHRGADVVDEIRHQQTGHSHPDAVDGVDDAGNEAEGQQIRSEEHTSELQSLSAIS